MLQINSLIIGKLGEVFSRELEMPSELFVTISKVETGSDLKTAKVKLTVFPFEKSQDGLALVIRHKKAIQRALGKLIAIKFTPKLFFVIDDTEEKVDNIYKLIDDRE